MTTYDPRPQQETPNHFVYVDGPSIDGRLGDIVGHRPTSAERPDWRRLAPWVREEFGPGQVHLHFATNWPGAGSFLNFLESAGFKLLLAERMNDETCHGLIVDSLEQIPRDRSEPGSRGVVVVTEQQHLIERMDVLRESLRLKDSRVAVVGFGEDFPPEEEYEGGLEFFDIEDEADLFRNPLPRAPYEDGDVYEELYAYDEPTESSEDRYERRETSNVVSFNPGNGAPAAAARQVGPVAVQEPVQAHADGRPCYLLVDGNNIDQVLGEILGGKPTAETRPDWLRVLQYVEGQAEGRVRADFAHIAPGHAGFRHAITEMGYKSRPVRFDETVTHRPVVEQFVCKALTARPLLGDAERGVPAWDVFVVGHSRELFEALSQIQRTGQRIAVLGLPEHMPFEEDYPGIEQLDIEKETGAFSRPLPRDMGINVDMFDPDALFEDD